MRIESPLRIIKPYFTPQLNLALIIGITFCHVILSHSYYRVISIVYNHLVGDAVFLISAIFLFWCLIQGIKVRCSKDWVISGAVLLLVGCLAVYFSPNTENAVARLRVYLCFFVFTFSLYSVVNAQPEKFLSHLLIAILVNFLFFAPQGLYAMFHAIDNLDPFWVKRIPYFSHIRHFGYYSFIAACISLILFLTVRKHRFIFAAITIFALTTMIWPGSRGAIISWMAFVFFSGIFIYSFKLCVRYWLWCGTFLTIAVVIVLLSPWNQLAIEMVYRSAVADINVVSSNRLAIWHFVLVQVFEKPLFGFGPDGFFAIRKQIDITRGLVQPHGVLIQLVLEFGWLGGTVVLAVLWRCYRRMYQGLTLLTTKTGLEKQKALMLALISAYFIFSLIDGLFYHALPIAHFCVFTALVLAYCERLTDHQSSIVAN